MKSRPCPKSRRTRLKKSRALKIKIRRHRRRRVTPCLAVRRPRRGARHTTPTTLDTTSLGSLDFPGRDTLYPHEIAARVGCTAEHIYNLIVEGQLQAIDISDRKRPSGRRTVRVPIESWHKFVTERTI